MASSADEIRRQLEESARVKQSFSSELIARIGQFAEKSAAALRGGGKLVFFGNGGSAGIDDQSLGAHGSGQRLRIRTDFLKANRITGRPAGCPCGPLNQRFKRKHRAWNRSRPGAWRFSCGVHRRNRRSADGQSGSSAQRSFARPATNPGSPHHHWPCRLRVDRADGHGIS
jgi:hypothetical protein